MGKPDLRYADVTCADCGKEYVCTPDEDYFHPGDFDPETITATNGYCWTCFMKIMGMNPEQPEPPYSMGD
jgi:hypothetical protein